MKKELKDRLAEIEKVLEKVISDRKKVSRSEAIEFCEEVESLAESYSDAMKEDEKREQALERDGE